MRRRHTEKAQREHDEPDGDPVAGVQRNVEHDGAQQCGDHQVGRDDRLRQEQRQVAGGDSAAGESDSHQDRTEDERRVDEGRRRGAKCRPTCGVGGLDTLITLGLRGTTSPEGAQHRRHAVSHRGEARRDDADEEHATYLSSYSRFVIRSAHPTRAQWTGAEESSGTGSCNRQRSCNHSVCAIAAVVRSPAVVQ